jgi:hypothetical protein
VPRLVYHMSSKLKNESIDNLLGKDEEVKLIQYLHHKVWSVHKSQPLL